MACPRVGPKARPRTGSGRPSTTFLIATPKTWMPTCVGMTLCGRRCVSHCAGWYKRKGITVLRIGIIGAGIGGLTAAVALRQAGFEVDVYEQAPELTEVGGGINMGPNAVRVLRRLGLGPGLDREGVRPLGTHQRRWQDGRSLQKASLNPQCEALYGAPHITIHRADLLAVIAAGLPSERIHLDHRLVGLAEKAEALDAWFE